MKLPLKWLEDFVDLDGLTGEDIGTKLTLGLCEVEDVEEPTANYEKVVVGRIVSLESHPQADRLSLTSIDVGQDQPLSIVCGATNIASGQLVPVAQIGARLPGEAPGETFKIKKSKIRGVTSEGMLCSEKELGMGDSHEGILQLASDLVPGTPFDEIQSNSGAVLTIDNKSLTHRPDCWGFLGLARELGALLQKPFKGYDDVPRETWSCSQTLSVQIEDPDGCPFYRALKVNGLTVQSSPAPWKEKLESAGVKSINNIVDATNLVLLEIGQPLHAFDATCVADESLIVRRAQAGETLATLDGVERNLTPEDLLIADKQCPLALAGIMGGEASAVSEGTTSILLEGANFDSGRVRQSAQRIGLRTDSSTRFEKGLPPWLVRVGLERCVAYLKESCPNLIVESESSGKWPEPVMEIDLGIKQVQESLGCNITDKESISFLEALGFSCQSQKGHLSCRVPPWRSARDISRAEDLIEEIGRLYGYSKLEPRLPMIQASPANLPQERRTERRVRRILADACGAYEILSHSFTSDRAHQLFGVEGYQAHLENPVQEDRSSMRSTLMGGLFEALVTNHREVSQFSCFELGRVFHPNTEKLPQQPRFVAGLHRCGENSFHEGKRSLEALASEFGLESFHWKRCETPPAWAHPGRCAELVTSEGSIALLAEIHPKILEEEDVVGRVSMWESSLESWLSGDGRRKQFTALPKFPAVRRDMAIVVPESVSVQEVVDLISHKVPRLVSVELFDIYRGQGLEEGEKSLAFHMAWQDSKKTLTDDHVDGEEDKILKKLSQQSWRRR